VKPFWDETEACWRVRARWTINGQKNTEHKRFPSKAAASAWCKETQAEIAAARALANRPGLLPRLPALEETAPPPELPTLQAFAPSFFDFLRASEASPSTIAGYRAHWRSILAPVFGELTLDRISAAMVDRFRLGRREQGRKPEAPLAVLSSMLSLAQERYPGKLPANPCHALTRRRRTAHKKPRPPAIVLSPEQTEAVRLAFPLGRERLAFCLGAYCGLRLGEVRGLGQADLHLDQPIPFLTVRHNIIRGEAPGALSADGAALEAPDAPVKGALFERVPKDGEARDVPVYEPWLLEELRLWQRRKVPRWPEHGSGPYLLAADDGTPLRGDGNRCSLRRAFSAALEAAGAPRVRFQDLRATCASNLLRRGVPRSVVKAILGHAQDLSGILGEDVLGRHYERIGLEAMWEWRAQ